MDKYSLFSLVKHAFTQHKYWKPHWRSPDPKPYNNVVIVSGGHGLVTTNYLAKKHSIKNIGVLEKGYLHIGADTDDNTIPDDISWGRTFT